MSSQFINQKSDLVSSDKDMLQQAIEQMILGDFNARWSASKVLKKMGEDAHPSLISLMESNPEDSDLLGFIAEILGDHPSPSGILALGHLLQHCEDDEVRTSTVLTLAKQGPSCVRELMSYANDPRLVASVVKALNQINHPSTIEGLLRFIEHDHAEIRAVAFEGLGQFHQSALAASDCVVVSMQSETITTLLISGLKDTHATVRGICVKALGMRHPSEIDEALITAVSPLLYDVNDNVCNLAAKTLGRLNHALALESLWHRLIEQARPESLTPALIHALGWAGHPQGIHYLLTLLKMISEDENHNSRMPWPSNIVIELIQTLSSLNAPKSVNTIELALSPLLASNRSPFDTAHIKQTLTMSIASLGQDSSILPLIETLKVEDDRLRLHIIAALKQINSNLSYERLLIAAQDLTLEPELKAGIAIALNEW